MGETPGGSRTTNLSLIPNISFQLISGGNTVQLIIYTAANGNLEVLYLASCRNGDMHESDLTHTEEAVFLQKAVS